MCSAVDAGWVIMKKYFLKGFLLGFFSMILITVLRAERDMPLEEKLYYEDELFQVEGYEDLSGEQKRRIESLKENYKIGEMEIFRSGFNDEWYETYNDVLVKKEIVFKDINTIYFDGGCYQMSRISSNDAYYYRGMRFINPDIYFGKKEAVKILFESLDDGWNGFFLILAGNGNIFFLPGEFVNYGNRDYTHWGMYKVLSDQNESMQSGEDYE